MDKVDITVRRKILGVHFECPDCLHDNLVEFDDFTADHGEPCDWSGQTVKCESCEAEFEIDDVDW